MLLLCCWPSCPAFGFRVGCKGGQVGKYSKIRQDKERTI